MILGTIVGIYLDTFLMKFVSGSIFDKIAVSSLKAKFLLFTGLLHVGDIIKQVNGEKVKGDPDEILSKLVSNGLL